MEDSTHPFWATVLYTTPFQCSVPSLAQVMKADAPSTDQDDGTYTAEEPVSEIIIVSDNTATQSENTMNTNPQVIHAVHGIDAFYRPISDLAALSVSHSSFEEGVPNESSTIWPTDHSQIHMNELVFNETHFFPTFSTDIYTFNSQQHETSDHRGGITYLTTISTRHPDRPQVGDRSQEAFNLQSVMYTIAEQLPHDIADRFINHFDIDRPALVCGSLEPQILQRLHSSTKFNLPVEDLRRWRHDSGPLTRQRYSERITDTPTPFSLARHLYQAMPSADHFQLRNLVVSATLHDTFYANKWTINHISQSDPVDTFDSPKPVFDLRQHLDKSHDSRITTIDYGNEGILMAGTLGGSYAYGNMYSYDTSPTTGTACGPKDFINHISISPKHTHPVATIACNDITRTLVTIDLHRNQVISGSPLVLDSPDAHPIVNCTALSPCGRLRLLVGDFPGALISDARSPTTSLLHTLPTDAGSFAASWAHDSWHVATASDSGIVHLWDARTWKTTKSFAADMAPVRTMRFSPEGGGPLTLFAAETWDYVHVIDVQTRRSQRLEYFGECAGLSVSDDGRELVVGNGDIDVGGIMVYKRDRGWEDGWGRGGDEITSRSRRRCYDLMDIDVI
jgi:hypothetical protein